MGLTSHLTLLKLAYVSITNQMSLAFDYGKQALT